ncbi:MAG: hypothetical protein VYA34_01220 [Myxococcota bacterium]|nr:hypothetical protein [Myxococcota bacterium]
MSEAGTVRKGETTPKELYPVKLDAPPASQRFKRDASFAQAGSKKNRYTLPDELNSHSPVGYRTRISLSESEVEEALGLLALSRPTAFETTDSPTEQELFEECSLGVLSSRQSTNFRGHQQVTFGPKDSAKITRLLRKMEGGNVEALDNATHTHVVFSRPYRTPFTMLLTLVGHEPMKSLVTVPMRIFEKWTKFKSDIPTIGYLQQLHLGILADAMERAAVLASGAQRKAQVHLAPFCGSRVGNRKAIRELEKLCGLTRREKMLGWRVSLVAQVGQVAPPERTPIKPEICRQIGANLLAFRSERIQPGVNQEEKAPEGYQQRQDMDFPEEVTLMCGRAAYNAFAHWTGCCREAAKEFLLLDRVDVLTPNGKERLRSIRQDLSDITDSLVADLPLWADLPSGRTFSRNAGLGRKAFALVGQRIYIAGLSRTELFKHGMDWELAVCAVGAAASRSSLFAEIMGCYELSDECDLLAGTCIMAGPVNQNDIGKQFYGYRDLLHSKYGNMDPTSLLVWTLKGKTITDPIGNEEQLLNAKRKGALVDLRCGPHDIVKIANHGNLEPMRQVGHRMNQERAFSDQGNFVTDPTGQEIPGNRGELWGEFESRRKLW